MIDDGMNIDVLYIGWMVISRPHGFYLFYVFYSSTC